MKIREIKGPFTEVYPAAASVFESLPSREIVEEALILGQFGRLQAWYEEALADEYHPGSINEETVRMDIDYDQRVITMITPTSGRIIIITFLDGILETLVNFGEEGSEVAAGYVIRHIKHFHSYPAAIYTLVHSGTFQVAFITPHAADVIFFRRIIGPDENMMWKEMEDLPEKWPRITKHRTMEEYNANLVWSCLRNPDHEENIRRIMKKNEA
ncbi:hypothetical protein [Paenibacillus terreus]|uniref:hypothetical protein n=1 Tax=Paenibacillus terreus TaxID=1387834 RepID=UPI0035CD3033